MIEHDKDCQKVRLRPGTRADCSCNALDRANVTLAKINDIRNSIVGTQTINWSEHIYPLVAALEAAGIKGMPYPEALANFGTLIERTNAAESELAALRERVQFLERLVLNIVDKFENELDAKDAADELRGGINVTRAALSPGGGEEG